MRTLPPDELAELDAFVAFMGARFADVDEPELAPHPASTNAPITADSSGHDRRCLITALVPVRFDPSRSTDARHPG